MSVAISTRSNLAQLQPEIREELEAAELLGDAAGVTVANDASYARFLRPKGFIVVDEVVVAEELDITVAGVLGSGKTITKGRVDSALKLGAARAVARMQDFTGKTRDGRPAHLGGWGDVTTNLASRFYYQTPKGRPVRVPYDRSSTPVGVATTDAP